MVARSHEGASGKPMSNNTHVRYAVMNTLTGEFLTKNGQFTAVPFEARLEKTKELGTKLRTEARRELDGEVPAAAIVTCRMRMDVRFAQIGRPRKVQVE